MSKCHYCGLEIIDDTGKCPLCSGVLEGEQAAGRTYPNVATGVRKRTVFFRIVCFVAIVTASICMACNIRLTPHNHWSGIVAAALLYVIWLFYIFFKDNAGYRVRIASGVLGAVLLIIAIDYFLGFTGWSVSYVLPSGIILLDVALAILMIVNRRNWQSYLILEIALIFVCILPLVMMRVGVVHHSVISDVALMITALMFVGSMILGGHTARTEMKRRFHM